MIYRRFGRTELEMPVLSCGGMRYQYKWQDQPLSAIPAESQQNLEATIRRALEAGVNHIETARGYGSSERQLGQILPTVPRESLIVQTKIVPTDDPAEFVRYFHESLERLRLDHVDLLALHGLNDAASLDRAIRPGGCFEAAQRLREQGKARYIGFSTHAPTDLVLRALRHGEARTGAGFDYVNLHWYFIFQRNWPAIEEAARRDMGVFIISPSDKGGLLYEPSPELSALCAPLSPMVFNDLFCLARPEVHTLSTGAARPSDFDAHLEAVRLLPGAGDLLPEILARLGDAMEQATGLRDPEAITLGVPDSRSAPAGLHLQSMLWLGALAKGWGMVQYGKKRFNLLGNGGHWFPGAPPAKLRELPREELARAVAASPHAARIPALLDEAVEVLGGAAVQRESRG